MAASGQRIVRYLLRQVCTEHGWPVPPLHFDRIGLDAEQVQRYGVTPRPPKPSEHPGMLNYIAECAEVDFLRSEQIEEIVREGIERERQNRPG
jgi:hypothetical protein